MNNMRAFSICVVVVSSCTLAVCVWVSASFAAEMNDQEQGIPEQQQDERIRKRLEENRMLFEKMHPATISGKVVDQFGNSIEGADVIVSWEAATWLLGKRDKTRRDWFTTDKYGFWIFTLQKPFYATIKVKKTGYEESCGFPVDFSKGNVLRNSPVIITLRKKGETTFLVKGESYDAIRVFAPDSQTNSVDVLWTREDGKRQRYLNRDFTVAAEKVSGSNTWTVTYTATGATGGMIFTNELLYVAPSDGYQREVVLNGPPWPTYMYLRSRSPSIYSRVQLRQDTWWEPDRGEGFRLITESWVNPYGDRNLEYDSRLETNWHVMDELRREAKAAIQAKRLPPKPDVSRRIKAMNERLENEKAGNVRSTRGH